MEKRKTSQQEKRSKGITLIALVVTIIVLLILAGISISMLTGENGIITRAGEAKEKTEESSGLEYLQTEAYSALLSYYGSNSGLSEEEYVLQELSKLDGVETNQITGTVTYNGKTYNVAQIVGNTNEQTILANNGLTQVLDSELLVGNNIRMVLEEKTENGKVQAVIPVGFYYVGGSITGGLVVSDVEGDDLSNSKGGNQFVWVPCNGNYLTYEKENGLAETWKEKYCKNTSGEYTSYQYYYTNYVTSTTKDDGTTESTTHELAGTWTDNGGDSESVKKYGGFYVGRYEAGVPNETFYSTEEGASYITASIKNTDTLSPVSKKNTFSWNYISQEKAVTVSSKMYEGNTIVTSSLIDSYAWDTIVEWMEKNEAGIAKNCNNRGNYANATGLTVSNGLYAYHRLEGLTTAANAANQASKNQGGKDIYSAKGYQGIYKTNPSNITLGYDTNITKAESEEYGFDSLEYEYRDTTYFYYHLYKEIQTGSSEGTKINNIYDMAGNMWEWTTETGNPDGGSTKRAVLRGGSFNHNGSSGPVCYRNGYHATSWTNPNVGFRVVLYIK